MSRIRDVSYHDEDHHGHGHYTLIDHNTFAEILRTVREDIIQDGSRDASTDQTTADVEHRLVDLFKDDNPDFDEDRFRSRAGAYGRKSS